MRLALTVSLAALLSCSIVQADDETTAAAPAAAASPAAESNAAPATEATPATSAVPATQPEASEPARQAEAESTPAAKAAEPAAPAMTKEQEQAAFNDRMKRQGYKLTTLSGQTVYCKGDQNQMGTRLGRKTMCWTADQIKAREDDVQTVREKQGQKESYGGT